MSESISRSEHICGEVDNRSITRELPNNVPFPAKAELIRRFTASWATLTRDLLAAIRPVLDDLLDQAIQEVFGRFHDGMLPATIK